MRRGDFNESDLLLSLIANDTNETEVDNSTTTTAVLITTTSLLSSPAASPTISSNMISFGEPSQGAVWNTTAQPSATSHHALVIFATALFIAAVLLIVKVIISHNKKRRALMTGGSARWRLSTSTSSAQGGHLASSAAVYTAMPSGGRAVNSMDLPIPESRFDWERQFFDEGIYGDPSRDLESNQIRTRLQLQSDAG